MRGLSLSLLVGVAVAGCSGSEDAAAPVDTPRALATEVGLEAVFVEDGVQLRNRGQDILYYAVFAEGALALFAPCLRPPGCPSVGPGEKVLVPFSEITAWDATSSAAEVHYWTLKASGDGEFEARRLGSLIVRQT